MSDNEPKPPREPAPALLWGLLGALAVLAFLVALKLMSGAGA